VLIHQPLMYGLGGQASEIDIHARELMNLKKRLNQIMANHTGQPIDKIDRDTDRDYILSAEQAVEYGIVDQVISRRE
jgi:ATP-dependent Clp protease, protease subunit